jgi:cytochrome c oxidase subunit 2
MTLGAPLRDLLLAGYLPEQASSVAEGVDQVFGFLFWLSAFFLAVILGLTVLFVLRYRRTATRTAPEPSPDHSTRLELVWVGVPLALVFVIFAWSTRTWLQMIGPAEGPAGAHQVQVTARKWSWWFDHPGGKGAKDLHVVARQPVELLLASSDVIHSLYVPEFRLKQDAVPGRFTRMVFTPTLPGTYPILCAEFCGTNHSTMSAAVVVHRDQAVFEAWSAEGRAEGLSLLELGRTAFEEKGCVACHNLDGEPGGIGPTAKGMWGREEKLVGGGKARVDEDYVRESILHPEAKIVEGYENVMPPLPLEERELQGILLYLRSLGKEGP